MDRTTRSLEDTSSLFLEVKHPEGYTCRRCGYRRFFLLSHRSGSWECRRCGDQESFRSGTTIAGSRIPVGVWIRGYEEAYKQRFKGTAELQLRLGLDSRHTARRMWKLVFQTLPGPDSTEDERAWLIAALSATPSTGEPASTTAVAGGPLLEEPARIGSAPADELD